MDLSAARLPSIARIPLRSKKPRIELTKSRPRGPLGWGKITHKSQELSAFSLEIDMYPIDQGTQEPFSFRDSSWLSDLSGKALRSALPRAGRASKSRTKLICCSKLGHAACRWWGTRGLKLKHLTNWGVVPCWGRPNFISRTHVSFIELGRQSLPRSLQEDDFSQLSLELRVGVMIWRTLLRFHCSQRLLHACALAAKPPHACGPGGPVAWMFQWYYLTFGFLFLLLAPKKSARISSATEVRTFWDIVKYDYIGFHFLSQALLGQAETI